MCRVRIQILAGALWVLAAGSVFGGEVVYDICEYGAKSDGIVLLGNDFSGVEKVLQTGANVAKTAISGVANID